MSSSSKVLRWYDVAITSMLTVTLKYSVEKRSPDRVEVFVVFVK